MSFSDWSNEKKKKKEEEETKKSTSAESFSEWSNRKYGVEEEDIAPVVSPSDVAKTILDEEGKRDASLLDLTWNSLTKGYYNSLYGEETFAALNGGENNRKKYADILAGDEYQFEADNWFEKGVSGAFELIGQQVRQLTNPRTVAMAGTAGGAAAIAGQVGPQVLLPEEIVTVPSAILAGFAAGTAVSNFEIEAGHAYNEMLEAGISEETAKNVALGVGGVNAALELVQLDELVDAYKVVKKGANKTLASKLADILKDRGVDVAKETAQEVAQEGVTIAGTQFANKAETGEWAYGADEVTDRLADTAVSSALSFGMMNVPAAAKNTASVVSEQKAATSLTANEQAVVDKVYADEVAKKEQGGKKLTQSEKDKLYDRVLDDMEKGRITTETIEEVLGGDTYKAYQDASKSYDDTVNSEEALKQELLELRQMESGKMNDIQRDRLAELKGMNLDDATNRDGLKQQMTDIQSRLSDEVSELVKGDRLIESYNDKARRYEDFVADFDKYKGTKHEDAAKKTLESAVKAGANNTIRVHDLVDLAARTSADTGISFDFQSGEQIKADFIERQSKKIAEIENIPEAQRTAEQTEKLAGMKDLLAKVQSGETVVNGNITENGIVLNLDSAKPLNRVVGHEVTHSFESGENYKGLHDALFAYAKTKGVDIDAKLAEYKAMYEGDTNADPEAEMIADMVGDFLFDDGDFVKNLSVQNRNVFQKIWDEIKYLCRVAKAGSQEARDLERVKKAFEDAYREGGKSAEGTEYSLESVDGIDYVRAEKHIFLKEDGTVASERDIFNSLVGKTIPFPDGDVRIVKNLPKKDMYNELYRRYPAKMGGVSDAKQLNSDVNHNMEELLTNSGVAKANIPDADGKHQEQGITSFDTRTVKFYDGDKAYDIMFSIAKLENGEKVAYAKKFFGYDEVLTKKIQATEAGSEQSPVNQQPVSKVKIPQSGGVVKNSLSDSDGRQLSKEQQEYFKDSKVRDDSGNLKVVYHGSPADFNTFSLDYLGTNGTAEGYGFYFTDKKSIAENYSKGREGQQNGETGKLFEVYLDIKKPLSDTEVTMTRSQFKKFLTTLNNQVDADGERLDVLSNYGDVEWEGLNKVLNYAMEIEYDGSDSDVNLVHSIINGCGDMKTVFRVLRETIGYDGIIVEDATWGDDQKIYLAFHPEQIKNVDNLSPTSDPDIRRSLSNKGEAFAPSTNFDIYGKDFVKQSAPVEEVAPVRDTATVAENATVADDTTAMFPDDLAPIADDPERFDSLTDADAPPERVVNNQTDTISPDDPFYDRDIGEVGKRNVKAYMYENPEVKPFFQEEALGMLSDLNGSVKGERWFSEGDFGGYGAESYYRVGGTKRHTTDDIAELLDVYGYSYAEIEKGLNAIIEDHGAENNAVSKRIEFMLNDRLMYGYKDVDGRPYPPNQDYINLLNEKQINEYSKEAFDAFMANADQYAPPISEEITEDIAPVANVVAEKAAPVKEESLSIKPKAQKEPRMAKATPQEQARANILTEEPKVDKKKPTAWNLFKDNFVDKGTIFETLSLKTGNRELQAKWKSIGRAESSAQWFMEHGNAETSSLKSIRETVEKSGKTQQFYEYLYHMHNVDRMNLVARNMDKIDKPVFGYDVTSEMSKAEAAKLEAENPEFKEWAEEVYAYNRSLRQSMVDSGVISQETADWWEKKYPHYVPVRRKGDEGLNINVALDTKRTGVNAPVKKATGGNRDILPLFDTMAMRTEQIFRSNARNRFGVELKNLIATDVETEAVDIDEIIDSVENEEVLQEGKNGKNPTFTVFENGEKVTFDVTEEMYDTMKPKSKGMAYTNKVLNTANNIRRGLLTEYNPAFMLTNPIKDSQDVLINSQHPARTYWNYPNAIRELWGKKGQYYREYMEHGGEMNTYFDGETKTFAKEKSGLSKVIGFPLEKISQANNFIERIPRMAEYIASRKEGRSIDVSMLDAARVTTDFSAGGDVVKWANRNGFTFLNASVQGAAQQVRNVREAKAEGLKGWAKLAAKAAVAGLPSILLNHLLWDDDEEYEELSDYVKQNYYIVAKYGDGKFVRIPKGRALAVIQDTFEQMENLVTGNDEVDFDAWAELFLNNLAPSNPLENNLIAPITQALSNKTWYGDDLVPTRLQDLPVAEQYDETTDSISKWLGEHTPISPYKWNYILDQYSGAIGDMFLPMLTPEAERGNNSLVGNMIAPITDKFTTDSVLKNQNVSDFYDTKDELTMNAKASGSTEEDVLMSKYMNSINAELSDLYKQKREIQNSSLSDAEKYEAVREIQSQIVDLTRESLNTYEDVSITGDYATVGNRHYRRNDDGEWTKLTAKQLEKQEEVTSGLGISASDYWGNKEEYDYAYEYPEKYAVAKSVGGYEAYKGYSSELYDIKADKDEDGKSITGSRKEKVIDWVNNLDADYGTKIILFKSEYNADDTYNYDIIEYLNGRNDISYKEMETILKELGFDVDAEGNISW